MAEIVTNTAHASEQDVKGDPEAVQGGSYALHVQNLAFQPSRGMINQELVQQYMHQLKLGWLIPSLKESTTSFRESTLHRVRFTAHGGELTGLIGSRHERRELVRLLVGRQHRGFYDGNIALSGPGITAKSYYYDNVSYVQTKPLYIPGLTYVEMLKYSIELRLRPQKGVAFSTLVNERLEDILSTMNLSKCKDKKIEEYPNLRGEEGSDLRRLSIALEIAGLPPVMVIEDPTAGFDPAIAVSILQCLQVLASKGHIVICSFSRPSSQELDLLDRVVLLSDGFSIFSNSPKQIQSYFCGPNMGYDLKPGVELIDFILDIASGVERPTTQRAADLPVIMQEKYEGSDIATTVFIPVESASAFCSDFFYLYGYGRFDPLPYAWSRLVTVVKRAIVTKFKDRDAIRTGFGGALIVSLLCGYLQFDQGNFGNYCLNLVQTVYPSAANINSLLFFNTVFSWAFPFLNAHVICQKLQLYRYERASGCCTTFAFSIASLLSEVPFNIFYMWVFATILFFMTGVGQGSDDYFFYVTTVGLNSLVGLGSAYMLSSIFKRELAVRDVFLLVVTLACLLSGFPFQLPYIRSYMADATVVNPLRWTFESLMTWKYNNYVDGPALLKPFGLQSFDHRNIYRILGRFLGISAAINVLFLLKGPNRLRRKPEHKAGVRTESGVSRDSMNSIDLGLPTNPVEPEVLRRRSTRQSELVKPLLFMRESSVTGRNSKLSVNLSQMGEENTDRGPTLLFQELNYIVKDTQNPGKEKVVLNRVTGMFDWGKLSMVLGGAGSGKSSLLHILAGDVAIGAQVQGSITFNGRSADPSQPLWQRCGFVAIQNSHMRDLTVRQIVTFAMKLRMHNRLGMSVLEENVKKTIEILHLEESIDKKAKFLNAGELKRLSIAEEMVHGPKLLLMDEPLTGVSQYEASVMMLTFREMVNQDRTVVASVYQPTSEMFKLFDSVLLLSQGRAIYYGPVANAANFFVVSPFGYDLSNYTNPADFLADIAGGYVSDGKGDFVDPSLLENYYLQSENFNRLKLRFTPRSQKGGEAAQTENPMFKYGRSAAPVARDSDYDNAGNGSMSSNNGAQSHNSIEIGEDVSVTKKVSRLFTTTPLVVLAINALFKETFKAPTTAMITNWFFKGEILIWRSMLSLGNRYELLASSLVAHILLGCLFGWIMGDTTGTTGIYNTTSFFAIGSLFLILFNLIFVFFMYNSQQVFLKEYSRGLYSNTLKWFTLDWPLYFLRFCNAILFVVIVWALTNQNDSADIEGFAVMSFMFMVLTSTLLAENIVNLAPNKRSCYMGITSLGFMNFIFSGLFIKAQSLPRWMAPWVPSLSMIRWNMQGNFINVYQNNEAAIPLPAVLTSIENLFGWGGKTKWYCVYMLLANILVYKTISFFSSGISAILRKGGRSVADDDK